MVFRDRRCRDLSTSDYKWFIRGVNKTSKVRIRVSSVILQLSVSVESMHKVSDDQTKGNPMISSTGIFSQKILFGHGKCLWVYHSYFYLFPRFYPAYRRNSTLAKLFSCVRHLLFNSRDSQNF